MTKHTKGPWVIDEDFGRNRRGISAPFASRPWFKLAKVVVRVDGEPSAEGKANLRLIAAAPELLDALEAVVRVADRNTDEFIAARAAIAKAKGGAA